MHYVLSLLKVDLGITHSLRDDFFLARLEACQGELKEKGVALDLENVEDQILLSDYAAWRYRNRMEDVPLSKNLTMRIRNRIVKGRGQLAN